MHIGNLAFIECSALPKLQLPQTLMPLGEMAFGGCALQKVVIPEKVTSIGIAAFAECSAL